MLSEIEYRKLLWHSRRGMWELDILLLPFAEQCVPQLSGAEQRLYRRLLREEDQDLFACLVERTEHPDPELQSMAMKIRDFAATAERPH